MGGEEREVLGVVDVEAPVSQWDDKVDKNDIASSDIDDGEEGSDERAGEEWSNDGPVKSEGPDAKATHSRADLLGCKGSWECPANPTDGSQDREEVPWNHVPGEAADQSD